MTNSHFSRRHIGPSIHDQHEMLKTIGVETMAQLIEQTVPSKIRINRDLNIPEGITEFQYSQHINEIGKKNKVYRTYIGMGYYGTIVPAVIQRNILENPGWYTAYTPYQAEISQGRLEALLNFQTMVMDLTGMEIANASLLDEATAAAEGMIMMYNARSREQVKAEVNKFFVSENCFPQTIDVIKTRALPLGIELEIGNEKSFAPSADYFGFIVQYPDKTGAINDFSSLIKKGAEFGCRSVVVADLMSLVLLTPPGEWGADIVCGTTQRFGVPMGYGGPHAAYFATKDEYKRNMPGRIIGVSVDRNGNRALRMALQTREQHIKRDKATSNICTAQALLAIMAGMYAVYHGAEGLKEIAASIHEKAVTVHNAIKMLGYTQVNQTYFDTLTIQTDKCLKIREAAETRGINFNYLGDNMLSISIDETIQENDLKDIVNALALGADINAGEDADEVSIPSNLHRHSDFLHHEVFSSYHSETEMMRYIKSLENKDLSLVHAMISLGSCTMKLNAVSELYPITNPQFCNMHPFVPADQALGYREIFDTLEKWLSDITGFDAVSFQPNSGAQGEYAGLMVIQAYHHSRGDVHRNVALIPSSAHGTNPASAAMAGMKIVVVKCDDRGNIDVSDLRAKAEENKDNLSCLMVTYPSTHGVFEESIKEITDIIHANGGQVYMDGANMNAQVGITNPGNIGADVCHLNLHKTFAIPHGGGGPGVGPIGVAKHLTPFLPGHAVVNIERGNSISAVSAAPWGSALILLISYGYIRMLGREGVLSSTEHAILNANYLKKQLEKDYNVLYQGENGRVAHEMILDCRDFKKTAHIEVEDIAKRLIDYGFHAPTVSFPVAGTLMVEPTESESKAELDRFIEAMKSIRKEIDEVEKGIYQENNVLKNAPHTAQVVISDNWENSYSREKAAYPVESLRTNKFWVSVGRVDNAYGDRNLVCSCAPIEDYLEPEMAG